MDERVGVIDMKYSLSVVIKPGQKNSDLLPIVGRWNNEIEISLSNPIKITKGPIQVIGSKAVVTEADVIIKPTQR